MNEDGRQSSSGEEMDEWAKRYFEKKFYSSSMGHQIMYYQTLERLFQRRIPSS